MNNLILDCSCGMSVFVESGDKVFCFEDKTQSKHSDEILKIIDDLLQQAKIKVVDLNRICVCVGPGSFTGVRVAVSVAKGLAIGTDAKIFVLSNFDIFHIELKNYILILDGFSSFVYTRMVKNDIVQDSCVDIKELVEMIKNENLEVFYTTKKTQNLLEKFKINGSFVKNNIISAFNDKIKRDESVEMNQIFPVYLRASQAEIEREKKKNA